MIAEGTYKARAIEGALGWTSGDPPKEQVAVEIVLLEGDEYSEGQHLTWYGFFTEKTTETTLKSLRAMGWAGDDLSDLTGIDANEFYAVLVHEEDQQGNLRARVRWINSTPGGLALKEKMDEGSARAFAERMKGHVLAQKQRELGTPAPTAKSAAANGGGTGGSRKPAPATKSASAAGEKPPF
jgi:hypothetical protein